jgi:hypothetical protein
MPPPLHPRHLRPCQSPWSAHQLRRAYSSPRDKPAAARHDTPKSAGADNTTGKGSWWSAAVARFSGPRVKPAPTAPHEHAQPLAAQTPSAVRAGDAGDAGRTGHDHPPRQASAGSGKEQDAMQQQIQQLAEQVRTLQDALGGMAGRPPPLAQPASTLLAPAASQRLLEKNSKAAEVLRLAQARYHRHVQDLGKIAIELERHVPKVAGPLVASIEQHLVAVGQGAIHSRDTRLLSELRRYKGGRLVGLAESEVAPFTDALKHYRHSAATLANITNELERMASPAVAHIAAMARERLDVIAREAELEGDLRMRDLMTLTNAVPSDLEKSSPFPEITEELIDPVLSDSTHVLKSGAKDAEGALGAGENLENLHQHSEQNAAVRKIPLLPTHSKDVAPTPSQHGTPKSSQETPPLHLSMDPSPQRAATALFEPAPRRHEQTNDESIITSSKPPLGQIDKVDGQTPISSQNAPKSASERTLLDELFPEAAKTSPSRYAEKREQEVPKLGLPKSQVLLSRQLVDRPKTLKEQVVESFQARGEKITILQLEHCSTELTEADFRRLIPQGKHIESWNREGEFYKVIPGRDPLSLERLPFYFLLFRSPESAYAYQNNATRLHKLTALHQPRNIFSAIPAPKGFLEDGEDINAVTSSYLLKPFEHAISLRMVMQPYHPALRDLIERGGYNPIVPNVDEKKKRIYKVLMHIEGYEPSLSDLFKIFKSDAFFKGMTLSLRNESMSSLHRLRDLINLKTRLQPISTTNPRAYGHLEFNSATPPSLAGHTRLEFDDPNVAYLMKSGTEADDAEVAKEVNQIVMNRVYNRWIIDFDDEDQARRFAVIWHRRVLPNVTKGDKTWKDYEEVRMCNCEVLW